VIASFHLVRYRRPVVAAAKGLVGEVAGLRFWRPLNVGGDFGWFRQHPTRWALYPRLRPDFHRWAYYAVWEDEAHLDGFLRGWGNGRDWRESAAEAYHVWLRPLEVRGPWEGTQLLTGSDSAVTPAGPVAYLTRLDLSLRATLVMWGSAAPRILRHLPDADELILGVPLVDRPYSQPATFSLWRTHDAAMAFAHRDGGHREAVRRLQRTQPDVLRRFSSAGFVPYRHEGSWNGHDPLASLRQAA
jgi:hypothetical protein